MSTFLPAVFGENMMDLFDDFDRDFFRGFGRPERALYGKNAARMMKTDVKETDEGYELDVDLPGMKKEEIHLDLQNGYQGPTLVTSFNLSYFFKLSKSYPSPGNLPSPGIKLMSHALQVDSLPLSHQGSPIEA